MKLLSLVFFMVAPVLGAQITEPKLSESESVFNGRDLSGWVTRGGRYDGAARWTIEEGALVGRQGLKREGGLIYTEGSYANAIISFDVKIDYPFDSGVFFRMTPAGQKKGAQICLDFRPDGEVGSIYADGFLARQKKGKARFKKDAWNTVTARIDGRQFRITAWLNGELLIDYQLDRPAEEFAAQGLIGLQVHGGEHVPLTQSVRFRDIRLRELPDVDPKRFKGDDRGIMILKDEAKAKGWRSLFNGVDTSGWELVSTDAKDLQVEDGVLSFLARGGDGYLRSTEDFRDFELQLDFRIAAMANSGVFLRASRDGANPAFSGTEIQILDDRNWEARSFYRLAPTQFTGSLYAAQAPSLRNATKPIGRWNRYQIRYEGFRIATRLNGQLLYDVDTRDLKSAQPPFAKRAKLGFIGLQRHAPAGAKGAYASFRNIFIRPLSAPKGR